MYWFIYYEFMVLNLSGQSLKDHVFNHTRAKFHGCLDSVLHNDLCNRVFKDLWSVSASVHFYQTNISITENYLDVFQSEFCFVVFWESVLQKYTLPNKHMIKNFLQTPQFFSDAVVYWTAFVNIFSSLVNHLNISLFRSRNFYTPLFICLESPGDLKVQ